MSIDAHDFRKAMSRFATGVTVVTSRLGTRVHGMTVNSLTSVSLRPPLVLFCAAHHTRTLSLIDESQVYAVNILRHDQRELCDRFAGGGDDEPLRFVGIPYEDGPLTGCPLFPGCLGWLECRVVSRHAAGDHVILVAEVLGVQSHEGQPLVFYASGYRALVSNDGKLD